MIYVKENGVLKPKASNRNTLVDVASDEYNSSNVYSSGDYCIYNNTFYQCTTDNTTGEWDSSKWQSTQIATEIVELNKYVYHATRRTRRNITNDLANLPAAVAEQDLAKYGYAIGDCFTGSSRTLTAEISNSATTQSKTVNITYVLADLNHERGTHSYTITREHIAILVIPHITRQWHSGDASTVGYNGSKLHTWLKGELLTAVKADITALFGDWSKHLIANTKLLTTALANWAWQESQYIVAPSEVEVYGSVVWGANAYQTGQQAKKLALFDKYKWTEIFGNEYIWLKDMQAASVACNANLAGYAHHYGVAATYYAAALIEFY